MPVVLRAYDERWPRQFAAERAVLERVLAPWLAGAVQHVGSTAVPGLAAKPVLDLVAVVADLPAAVAAAEPLRQGGYRHAPHRPDALWFHRPATGAAERHTHHLHLAEAGSALYRERIGFRDALRADPALAAAYQALKIRLADRYPDDLGAYTAGKRAFVAEVLAAIDIHLADRAGSPPSSGLSARALGGVIARYVTVDR